MADNYGLPDNAEMMYQCAKCGRMFEPENKENSTCPVCGNTCSTNSCRIVDGSNEDY